MPEIPQITRGDTSPDVVITIKDARSVADFSTLAAADVRLQVELNGALLLDDAIDVITPSADNKSAEVRRAWGSGETDVSGRYWVSVYVVPWDQHYPSEGPLRLDVGRAVGDP